jgi:hypothetical protein
MINDASAIRSLIIYAICLPLAIILGFLLTDPLDRTTGVVLAVVLLLLMLPLLFRWYHVFTIGIWNMSVCLAFLPGLLPGWMPVVCIGFAIAVGHYILNRERKFLEASSVAYSLIFLALVAAVTAKFRGGIGLRALGDESIGGKRYLWIWLAIVGYFVLTSQRVPLQKRKLYTGLFLLGSLTALLNDIVGSLGPLSNFVGLFFPTGTNPVEQNPFLGEDAYARFGGAAIAGVAVAYFLLARYGIGEILNLRKFWRLGLFLLAIVASMFGGYRSILISISITVFLVFCFEGLLRSRLMPTVILTLLLVGGITVAFSDHMPWQIQRCLAFLPLKLDPSARLSAESTSEWRLEIWQFLLTQVPHYLLLGKGVTFDSHDMAMYMAMGDQQAGGEVGGAFTVAGDYHSGPLSLIIPFGIWGVIGFVWFLIASIKVLWANYRHGDPEIRKINILLLSYFLSKLVIFIVIFGSFYSDLPVFVGIIGFSISLNGGIAKPALQTGPEAVFNRGRLLPIESPMMSN